MIRRLSIVVSLACLAWAEPLWAAPFSVSASNVTASDGSLFFTLSGDDTSRTGKLVYNENEPAPNGIDLSMTNFTDPAARFSVTGSQFVNGQGFFERSLSFTVTDPTFRYTVETGFGETTTTGYALAFDLAALYAPNGSLTEYDVPAAVPILQPSTYFEAYGVDVSGSPLSLVPLPASAPLFGTALLALGVFRLGLRRTAKTTA